ncbi:hypothetical protein E2562_039071 [Oryza meyeriana var. granulata]|uniref:Uncharacterized protein n=1 Tax=Oryza meyeriana var. granulata TaxID=110450 RepID=A0A6G1BQV1_9ORYZ|nr:hypothetical protein E2562_039071 [Oryza meyeriana var. granulata]
MPVLSLVENLVETNQVVRPLQASVEVVGLHQAAVDTEGPTESTVETGVIAGLVQAQLSLGGPNTVSSPGFLGANKPVGDEALVAYVRAFDEPLPLHMIQDIRAMAGIDGARALSPDVEADVNSLQPQWV